MSRAAPKRPDDFRLDRRLSASRWSAGIALLSLVTLASSALAAPLQCRHIDSRKERNACYEQQRQSAKKKAPDGPPTDNVLDQLKLENDRVTKRLQGICRGC